MKILILLTIIISFLINQTVQAINIKKREPKISQSKLNPNFLEDEYGLIILNDDNYETFTKELRNALVFAYKHPCKLCKQIFPELEKTTNPLRSLSTQVAVAKINITDSIKTAEKLNLNNTFSLKYLSEGVLNDYTGGRSGEEIFSWIREKFDAYIGEIKSVYDISQLEKLTEILIVFFGDNTEKYSIFLKSAKGKDNIIFARCNLPECLSKYSTQNGDIMVYIRSEGSPVFLRSDQYNSTNVKKQLEELSRPKVMKFNSKSAAIIFAQGNPGLFLYRSIHDSNLYDHLMKEVFDEAFRNGLKLVVSDIIDSYESKLAQKLAFNSNDLPRMVIHDTSNPQVKNYIMDKSKPITKENILQFIEDFKNKKLSRFLRSESVPVEQNENAYNLVGTTLENFVKDESKDVLIMFYAPWCKHSKALLPKFEKLAEKLKSLSNFSIGKFDAFNNEVEIIDIEYYPTVAIWPSDNKSKPVLFKGDYTKENDLLEFLRKNAYHKINFIENSDENAVNNEIKKLEESYEDSKPKNNASEL